MGASGADSPPRWPRRTPSALIRPRLERAGAALVVGFLAGLLALYVFADVAEDVLSQETQHVDDAVLAWMQSIATPQLDVFMEIMSACGTIGIIVVGAVALVVLALQRRWLAAVSLVIVTAGAQLLNNVLKDLFARTRPAPIGPTLIPAQQWSFPSGHAMVSAAFYFYIGYLCWKGLRGWARYIVCGLLLVLVLLIGISRLYLGLHFLSDVIAGYAAGFVWADAVIVAGILFERSTGTLTE
jgi:undecaprenyl-diphosphatase